MKMQQQTMDEKLQTPDISTGYIQRKKVSMVQKPVSDDVRVAYHSQGVVQRYVEAVLHSSLGDFTAQSQGADHRNLINAAALQGGNAKEIANRFMANIKPKTITDEDGNIIQENRPATQCAEPHALGMFLDNCNSDIDNAVLQSLEFTSVVDHPDDDSSSKGRDIRPCDVCKQWVEDKVESPKKVLISNIIGDLDIPKSEKQLQKESREQRAAKNAKKREKKKASRERNRAWEEEQKQRMSGK